MSMPGYRNQVELLLSVLPEVAKESCFALHGGTAINLFVRNMPRLSVDIDLTFLPIEDRMTSLNNISLALQRIKTSVEAILPEIHISHLIKEAKLIITNRIATIKIEVNLIKRGCYAGTERLQLCTNAQETFSAFCEMQVVEKGQLYGGKICAALDRQHPRDVFDIRYMLENEGFTEEIKKGFIFNLISSNRPINEILFPNFKDLKDTFEIQFQGMSMEKFGYEDYKQTRVDLIKVIHAKLLPDDKQFLLRIEEGTPDWNCFDFRKFPSVQWKLQNIRGFREQNPEKHLELYNMLKNNLLP